MIKDLTFGGIYKDKQLHVEAMLVNPETHGRAEYDMLFFEIRVTMVGKAATELEEWAFYIIGAQNRIYNAEDITVLPGDGISTMNLLVTYRFRTEYLYNDIRLGFLYEPYNCIDFVEINH